MSWLRRLDLNVPLRQLGNAGNMWSLFSTSSAQRTFWEHRPQTYYLLLQLDMDCECETRIVLVWEIEDEVLSRGVLAFDGPKEMSFYNGQLESPMRFWWTLQKSSRSQMWNDMYCEKLSKLLLFCIWLIGKCLMVQLTLSSPKKN